MSLFSRIQNQPEYIHVAINHFPLIGMLVAILALLGAIIAKSRSATFISLALLVVTAGSIWPVNHFGERGFDRVLAVTDEAGGEFLKYHAQVAHRWAFLYIATAGVSTITVALGIRSSKILLGGSILALVLAIISLVAGIYIAQAGGEVRHREFRFGPAPNANSSK